MGKKTVGVFAFVAGVAAGVAIALVNKENRTIIVEKANEVKENTLVLGGQMKETVTTLTDSISIELPKFLNKEKGVETKVIDQTIPEQLELSSDKKEEVTTGKNEKGVELFGGNGDILVK